MFGSYSLSCGSRGSSRNKNSIQANPESVKGKSNWQIFILLFYDRFNEQPRPKGRGIRRVRVVYHHVVLCILRLGFERNFLCFPHRRAARP